MGGDEGWRERAAAGLAEGRCWAAEDEVGQALEAWRRAFEGIPPPRTQAPEGLALLLAIGELCWLDGRLEEGLEALERARAWAGAADSGEVALRRGELLYDLGRRGEAAVELERAWLLGAGELLLADDPSYYACLQGDAAAPEGGWPTHPDDVADADQPYVG